MVNNQDADRLRDAITRDQTACRCGHLLAACADCRDCRDWLSENALRITYNWQWWLDCWSAGLIWNPRRIVTASAAEADDLAYFEARR